jgi:hypothetical protein
MVCAMRRSIAALLLVVASACKDEPPARTGPEPMRAAPGGHARAAAMTGETGETGETSETSEPEVAEREPVVLPERPRADPSIDRALDLISTSDLRFIDPADEPDERPSEYTAEQFAGMLRTKWDWIGYDLTELDPWLDGVATRSFKTNLAYQVVLADGTTSELRPWLDAQLRASQPDAP